MPSGTTYNNNITETKKEKRAGNYLLAVIIKFLCRHYATVTYSPMSCEWLLYCSFVVTMIQLYVA